MRDKSPAPIISPDGRFEIIIEDTYDRGVHDPYTVLVERATGERRSNMDAGRERGRENTGHEKIDERYRLRSNQTAFGFSQKR